MKRILLIITFLSSVFLNAQNKNSISLRGEIPQSFNGSKIYLLKNKTTIDSASVLNGEFKFRELNIVPDEYLLIRFNKEGKHESMLIYLDYVDNYVKMEEDSYLAYNTRFIKGKLINNPVDSVVREINELIINCNDEKFFTSDLLKNKLVSATERFDLASVFVLWKYCTIMFQNNLGDKVKECLEKLPEGIIDYNVSKELKEIFQDLSKVSLKNKVPNIVSKSIDGSTINLYEFAKGKKLVLIDFWASWCAPCRKEGENIKSIYKEFHEKGFDVLGVSLDDNSDKWKEAVEKDNLVWKHVSDLLGWKSPIPKLYNFNGIPTLYLVNGDCEVVEVNLRGEELRKKVEEICK